MDKIYIFDTTLRDGEQAPGASMGMKEKLEVARQLAKLKVDVIEAGFPIASPGDFEAVNSIAKNIKGPIICGLARAMKKDIDAAYKALNPAKKKRIHIFLATSKIHMKYKLKKAEDEILKQAVESVKYAKSLVDDVEFSPEDASRTEREFLRQVVEAVIDAGATVVNIPDTVGYAVPEEYGKIIKYLKDNVRNIDKAIISVHCHDDLGLSVSNSLEAVKNGARQVECTINGVGERAGNTSLEEIVMAISTRKDFFQNCYTDINKELLYNTSRLVSTMTGFPVPPNKAIVGANAFRHESGIHQHGVMQERSTYEIMKPEEVGFRGTSLVLGKHSGRHAVNERLAKLGFKLNESELNRVFEEFKKLADKKKEIFDDDLAAIVEGEVVMIPELYKLISFGASSGTNITPVASVKIKAKGKIFEAQAEGDGPVDACYKAINKITKIKPVLQDYSIHSVTKGREALGEVRVRLKFENEVYFGRGASTDIIEASAKAYINGINRITQKRK